MSTAVGFLLDGNLLRHLRRGARLTQGQMAYRVGCSTVHYRAVEAGRSKASETLVCNLADTFNVPAASLLAPPTKENQ